VASRSLHTLGHASGLFRSDPEPHQFHSLVEDIRIGQHTAEVGLGVYDWTRHCRLAHR
jgi:hypothetical protein